MVQCSALCRHSSTNLLTTLGFFAEISFTPLLYIPPQSQFKENFGLNSQCAYYNTVVHSVLDPCTACMFLLLSKRLDRASRARTGCLCRRRHRRTAALLRLARAPPLGGARWAKRGALCSQQATVTFLLLLLFFN